MTRERHLFLKLGVGVVGRGIQDGEPMGFVMHLGFACHILYMLPLLQSQAL